jgi:hypothetical protein
MPIFEHVYAIVRYDAFQADSVAIENRVTVTRVVRDEATARAEVARLNHLNRDKGCKYFWQVTRLRAGSE